MSPESALTSGATTVSDMMTELLGWVLAVAATVTAAPQAVRVLRTRTVEGISPFTCVLGVATMTAWTWFTVSIADIPAVASSVGPLLCWSACVWGLHRYGAEGRILRLCGAAGALTGLLCFAGLAGTVAVTGSLCWALPQAYTALRAKDLSGVSRTAYLLLTAENAGWILYAVATSTWQYAVAPLVQGPAVYYVSRRVGRYRRLVAEQQSTTPDCRVSPVLREVPA